MLLRSICQEFCNGLSAALVAASLTCVLHPARAAQWPEAFYNPAPLEDDVVLPMPCGGAMAFRKVFIPHEGPLDDYAVALGGTEDDYGYAENVHPDHIAGSFPEGEHERYYLLGKHEVNRLQQAALEAEACPEPTLDLRLPQTEVSWFDAVAFADRYTRWLRENAAEALPKDGKEAGFVRLPTETEWEFAARGGTAVAPADFRERTFPMPEGMVRYVWFAGTQSANGKPQFIGLLAPNPLGLHDMLGNVDEIVLEPFRLNRLNRLHGQAGGFIVRGGNYFTPEQDIRTSYRKEVPYYKGEEPLRATTTGFRVAVVGPVITSRERLNSIREAWSALGTTPPEPPAGPTLDDKPLDDPVQELGVLAEAASDPNLKARLGGLQQRLQDIQLALRGSIQEREDQRRLAAKASLRLGAFLCQKVAYDGRALDALVALIDKRAQALGRDDPTLKGFEAKRAQEEAVLADNLQYYAETILSSASIYDAQVLEDQLAVLGTELRRKGLDEVVRFAAMYHGHVTANRRDARVTRSQWLDDCKSVK